MKAIKVTFLPQTVALMSRYKACDADGNSTVVPRVECEITARKKGLVRPQDAAAHALCLKMKWAGTLNVGQFGEEYIYTWLAGGICQLSIRPEEVE